MYSVTLQINGNFRGKGNPLGRRDPRRQSKRAVVLPLVLLVGIALALPGPPPAVQAADRQETATGAADTAAPRSGTDGGSEKAEKNNGMLAPSVKLDKVGEKLGRHFEDLSEKAPGLPGRWINARVFAGISWLKLMFCLGLLLAVAVIERLVRALVDRHARAAVESHAPESAKAQAIRVVGKPLRLFIWIYGAYMALTPLFEHFRSPDGVNLVHDAARKGADLGTAVALIWFVFRLVDMVDIRLRRWAVTTESNIDDMLAPLLSKTLRIFIILIGAILVIQNLTGIQIGPLLASLGVGGIAIALAAKDSIANFFGTLTILFDKPFQIGQRVVIDSTDGTVEEVGFRSTRIRTLAGHLVTIPNEKLVNTTIENIDMRPHIRWLTQITLTYDTPPEKVEQAVAILRETLADHSGMRPDFPPRVYFNGFNDWSLNILMLAWYHPPDFWAMQEWQQRTCLEILRRFNDEGIEFAFPSQTVDLANNAARQLKLRMLKGEVTTAAAS